MLYIIDICFKSFKILHFDTMCNRMTSLNKILNNNMYSILIILPLRQVISHKIRATHRNKHARTNRDTHTDTLRAHILQHTILSYIQQSIEKHPHRSIIHLHTCIYLHYIYDIFISYKKGISYANKYTEIHIKVEKKNKLLDD